MDICKFAERMLGIRLSLYQKIILKNMMKEDKVIDRRYLIEKGRNKTYINIILKKMKGENDNEKI